MCMKWVPHQLEHDHTHFQKFYNFSNEFLEQIFIWPFELNSTRASASPFLNFNLNFCMMQSSSGPSTYLEEGSDNSPPLKSISSRDPEVCGRKEGYSALTQSSL